MTISGLLFGDNGGVFTPVAILSTLFGIFVAVLFYARDTTFSDLTPKRVKGDLPIIGSLAFFTKRWEFQREAMRQSPTGHFTYHAGQYPIVGLSGDEGRRMFFESKALDLTQGSVCRKKNGDPLALADLDGIAATERCLEAPLSLLRMAVLSVNSSTGLRISWRTTTLRSVLHRC